MSDQEFENYLALVTRLLRLRGKQRDAMAAELRAHLEDRLDELLARGVARHAAVRQALEEFGDAAGLAAEFVSIARGRKRRWLMRVTTFSVAATLLFAAGIAVLWPGRNAAPGVAAVVAQDPFADLPGKDPGGSSDKPTQEKSLEDKLNQRVTLEVVESPLKDVVTYLRESAGIQFVIKTKKLDEAGASLDAAVTMSLRNVRLSTILELVLEESDLTYVEKDDLILITTYEDAEATMVVRVYDCRDLLAMEAPPGADKFIPTTRARPGAGGFFAVDDGAAQARQATSAASQPEGLGGGTMPGGGSQASGLGGGSDGGYDRPMTEHDLRAERLMDIIQTNVDPQTWESIGGPGSISEYNGLVVVTQTAQTHKKVERVLNMLREAAGLDATKAGKVVR